VSGDQPPNAPTPSHRCAQYSLVESLLDLGCIARAARLSASVALKFCEGDLERLPQGNRTWQ
jgi:hypothetical protein